MDIQESANRYLTRRHLEALTRHFCERLNTSPHASMYAHVCCTAVLVRNVACLIGRHCHRSPACLPLFTADQTRLLQQPPTSLTASDRIYHILVFSDTSSASVVLQLTMAPSAADIDIGNLIEATTLEIETLKQMKDGSATLFDNLISEADKRKATRYSTTSKTF